MSETLFEQLGAKDEADAQRIVGETSKFVMEARAITGGQTFPGVLDAVKNAISLARDVEKDTGKTGGEAVAVMRAWKAAFDSMPAMQAKVTELDEKNRDHEVKALISQGLIDGKLTPATVEYWSARNAGELRAFLAVAPRVLGSPNVKAPTNPGVGAAAATADGKKYEDLMPSAKADLNESDPDLYKALRDDWIARGEPVGVVATLARTTSGEPLQNLRSV